MANITKLKRDKMLQFLHDLKKVHTDDASIRAFNEIENALLEKKFGLVFEEHTEAVDEKLKEYIPVLCADKTRKICKDPNLPYNFIIEGDNLQALYLLEKTHKGKVDCIYIDPPYNTGTDDFVYDDKIISQEDAYRHSKWLSFMRRRIVMGRNLLSDSGVMFVSIDDNEQAPLKLLCEEIFGPDQTDMMVWRKSGVGRDGKMKNTMTFRKDNEYIIVCYKNHKILHKSFEKPNWKNKYTNPDNDPRGAYKSGSISRTEEASNPNSDNYYTVVSPSGKTFTRQFEISKEEFEQLNQDKRIFWGINGDAVPAIKIFEEEPRLVTTSSLIDYNDMTTTVGSKEIESILNQEGLGKKIRPKPTALIKKLIQIASQKNSIVLDFFAGSGTTGQAVLEQNEFDGGERRFILCTNNEIKEEDSMNFFIEKGLFPSKPKKNSKQFESWKCRWNEMKKSSQYQSLIKQESYQSLGICQRVTFPRIQTVITGVRKDNTTFSAGLKGNVKYFKCDWTPRKPQDYLLSNALCLHITEMIELQNAIEVDNVKNVILFNKEDYKKYIEDKTAFSKIENLWVNQNIIFDAKEIKKLQKKHFKYIPKEFFGQELMEAAE